LAKDKTCLLKPRSAYDFDFDFRVEAYVFVACVMLKYDSNLVETRENLVPNEISEDDFWCNYFYAIECIKAELGLPTRLGSRLEESKRRKLFEIEDKELLEAKEQVEAREDGRDVKVGEAVP